MTRCSVHAGLSAIAPPGVRRGEHLSDPQWIAVWCAKFVRAGLYPLTDCNSLGHQFSGLAPQESSMSVQLQANKPVATVSPAELFEKGLPIALAAYKKQGMKVDGTFLINIFGDGGGSWFVDAPNGVVRTGANEATDSVLELGIQEFKEMQNGKLDAAAAMKAGKMRFRGNPEQLITLGQLLSG